MDKRIDGTLLFISTLCLILLCFLYVSFMGHDNTAIRYDGLTGNEAYWIGQYDNYRYINALLGFILYKLGIAYFSLVYLWSICFAASIFWVCYEFIRYCGIDIRYLPFFLLAVAANGYFSDLYIFAMVYSAYAMAFCGVAISLRSLRCMTGFRGFLCATIGLLITYMSYQTEALIILYAAAIALVVASIEMNKNYPIRSSLIAVSAFLASSGIFLIVKSLLKPANGRNVSFHNILGNIDDYAYKTYEILTGGILYYHARHEVAVYFLSMAGIILVSLFYLIKYRSKNYVLTVAAIFCMIAITACPFSLLEPTLWVGARMMTPAVFFFASSLVIIAMVLPKWTDGAVKFLAIIFLGLSVFHHVHFFAFMSGQDERDKLAVEMIYRDIKKKFPVSPSTKLAVIQINHPNQIVDQWRLSALSQDWSRTKIFRLVTGNFTEAYPPPANACDGMPDNLDWYVHDKNGVIVVCIR